MNPFNIESDNEEDEILCKVCNFGDNEANLILCDICNKGFHTTCLGLHSVPKGTWNCPGCAKKLENSEKRLFDPAEFLTDVARRLIMRVHFPNWGAQCLH